jgi:hypothetical protein
MNEPKVKYTCRKSETVHVLELDDISAAVLCNLLNRVMLSASAGTYRKYTEAIQCAFTQPIPALPETPFDGHVRANLLPVTKVK